MNILQIIAHPNTESSFTVQLAEAFRNGATNNGHQVQYLNIFDEVGNQPNTQELQQMISFSDHLCFAWPCWWEMPPAKLVDLFQTVFVKGFAFNEEDGKMVPRFKKNTSCLISLGQVTKEFNTVNLSKAMRYCGLIPRFFLYDNVGPRLTKEMASLYLETAYKHGNSI